jgi:hypothetical protein
MDNAGTPRSDARDDWSSRSFAAYTLTAGDSNVRFAVSRHSLASVGTMNDMPELQYLLRECLEAELDA